MIPNPLAAKFANWSSDEEEEADVFSGMGLGSPFGRSLNVSSDVSLLTPCAQTVVPRVT